MTITVTLEPELEEWVRTEAAREGSTPDAVVARAIAAQWAVARRVPHLSEPESELLTRINEGFPEAFWQEFRPLREKMETKTLTGEERAEFLRMNALIEGKNAERIRLIGELSRRRGVSLTEMMAQLGIGPIQVPEA